MLQLGKVPSSVQLVSGIIVLLSILAAVVGGQITYNEQPTTRHHRQGHNQNHQATPSILPSESKVRSIPGKTILRWRGGRNEARKSFSGSSFSEWQKREGTITTQVSKTGSDLGVKGQDLSTKRHKRTKGASDLGTQWSGSNHLALRDGAYDGLVVEVSHKVSQDHCHAVITGLQTVLQEWSGALHEATGGLLSLRWATVVLPMAWSPRVCHAPSSLDPPPPPTQTPHLRVAPPHSVFGETPWTQQSEGCGTQGDFIQLGAGFLSAANTSAHLATRAARVLVGEWAKYRWGLFSEAGYPGDQLYLPWYRQGPRWAATICTNTRAGPHPCHPDHVHHCTWPPEAHRNATSSILSLPQNPQVTQFCDAKSHNQEAPTKQNALCEGLSAWEVMNKHSDFTQESNRQQQQKVPLPSPLQPQLYFIRQPSQRFIILVEITDVMNVQRRWEFVRKAVRKVVVYDLPDGAAVAVVTFNNTVKATTPLNVLEDMTTSDLRERVGSSLPRNPSAVRESLACIPCGIRRAVQTLKEGGAQTEAANIVLITSGGDSREGQVKEVRQVVQQYGLKLQLVLYPLAERPGLPAPPHTLVTVARESGGSVFTVMDQGVGIDSKVHMLVSLMSSLSAAVSAGGASTPVLVHSATYQGGIASLSTGSFSLDTSLGNHARFAIYYYDLNHVGNTIHLTAPSGATFASVNMQEEDGDVNMISINLQNAERGVWRYKVENRADSHQALHIQVTSLTNPDNDVAVRVWTNQHTLNHLYVDEGRQIILYGEVKLSGSAVMEAAVMATLQRLGTNATGGTYSPVRVPLLDLGTGDPDITRGDGIYSRYAPPLDGPARYAVLLSVDAGKAVLALAHTTTRDHDLRHHRHAFAKEQFEIGRWEDDRSWASPSCCGSVVPFAHTREAPPFTRQITGPTLDIRQQHVVSRDKIPPAKILDLVAWVNDSSGLVALSWTAVGNDRDWGQAQLYEAYVAPHRGQAATTCTGERLTGLPSPAPATTKEQATVAYTVQEKKVSWVCMRAVDRQGNRGPPSNPAALWLPQPASTDQFTIWARGPGYGGYGSDAGIVDSEKAAVITGIVGGLILVVLIVTTYCYCLPTAIKRRINRHHQQTKDPEKDVPNTVNGGHIVKSASRGSVNRDPDQSHQDTTDQTESPSEERRFARLSPELKCQVQQVTPAPVNHQQQNEENQAKRVLSMSIPDVTRVAGTTHEAEVQPSLPSVSPPQFYTLGRHTSGAQRSPLRGSNGHIQGSSDLSQYLQQPQHRYSIGATPQYFAVVRPPQKSTSQETCSDDDNHFSDQLLCDDQGASPPPPAPPDNTHDYTSLHRHSLQLL